jgi:hypothetical protein
LCIVVIVVFAIFPGRTLPAQAAAGSILYSPNLSVNPNEDASYPRVIRLSNSGSSNGTLLATFSHSGNGQPASFPVYQSTNGGQTWSASPISVVTDTVHGWSLDGPTLFEFPQALGPYPAGTLLAAGTAWVHGPNVNGHLTAPDYTQQAIEVFRSADHGTTWSYLSSCASETGMPNTAGHGIWEPAFQVDNAGHLVCYFSDERQSGNRYNQLLAHVVSTDGGQTWGAEVYDVAIQDNVQRPGMPIVIKLPNGQYMMAFEECKGGFDPDQACSVYVKTSPDGDNWSPVNGTGTLVQTSDGRHFLHTPFLAWSPAGGANGTLIVTGQRLVTGADGSITILPESGKTWLINTNLGSGNWSELPAAFAINPTGGYDTGETGCPAYSSPVLPSATGTSILYLAGTVLSSGNCEVRYGFASSGALPFYAPLASGTDAGWATHGGNWSVTNGIYTDSASGPGDKSLAGSTGWSDYTLQGDVKLTAAGQAGLVFRVTNPGVGADAMKGYYIGLESTSGNLFLGRENGAWTGLTSTAMPGGVALNTWYHVTVQAVGCVFTVAAQAVGSSGTPTGFSYTDTGCTFTAGQVGVRDHYTTASWRNLSVTPGGTTGTATLPYYAPFAGGSATGWTTYGGTWGVSGPNETYSDSAGGAGDKSVAGSIAWTNYTLQGDVELTSAGANANPGFLVRVTNPAIGVDALIGYYAGVASDGTLIVGRENNGWTYLGGTSIPGGVSLNSWYHLVMQVQGCNLTISAQSISSPDAAVITYNDAGCTQTAGQIGVRTFNAASSWRFVSMSPN